MKARRWIAVVVVGLLAVACSSDGGSLDDTGGAGGNSGEDPGDCVVVDMSVSPEKLELLTDLAGTFNESGAEVAGTCVFVRVQRKSSGAGAQLLASGWDEASEGPRPVVWSPAASSWGAVLNQRLADQGEPAMVGDATPFMLTPLVIAMPAPMAKTLGYPEKPLGFGDILEATRNQQGWGAYGHPEWGPFKLGKTNPNFSTSGLSALIAQAYAATGKTEGLSQEDLDNPATDEYAKSIESAVVHYGDTTLTFLNNWYRADQRGNPYAYTSAVAVEEKSVIDYNKGNPDGILDEGEQPRKPKVPLVAIYPKEGTLFSDNPFLILDADWVSADEAKAAALFQDYVQEPGNQERVLDYGFRPANVDVAVGKPIVAANGVDPSQPQTLLEVPEPAVLSSLLDDWQRQRKPARVLLVLDISGSMGEVADSETGENKLDLAKQATIRALDDFNDDDEVGLSVFSTDLGDQGNQEILDLVPISRVGDVRESLKNRIDDQLPTNGTPLYTATQSSYESVLAGYAPDRINAVVLLTDGMNDDGDESDDEEQLDALISSFGAGSEGQQSRPVRVFTIGYGSGADLSVLKRIAEASSAGFYDSSDPKSISRVFDTVVSNF